VPGAIVALLRLCVFWGGMTLTANYPDWRQIAGYGLLVTNSLVELAIASAVTRSRSLGSLLTSALIVVTSLAIGSWWARRRHR